MIHIQPSLDGLSGHRMTPARAGDCEASSRRCGTMRHAAVILLAAVATVALPRAAEAQNPTTWLVQTGTWGATGASNWSNSVSPSGAISAYFGSNGGLITGNINILRATGTTAALGMTFDYAGGNTFLGDTDGSSQINIGANGITLTGSSGNVTIGGTTTIGTGRLNLLLNASQTWTNNSSSGILTIENQGTAPTLNLGTIGNTLTFAGSGETRVQRIISGTGSLVKQDSGLLRLSGANTFNGGLTLAGGTLRLDSDSALGTGTFTITAGSIDVNANRTIANAINWNGDFAFVSTSGSMVTSGAVTLGGAGPARRVTVTGSTLGIFGVISGTHGLTKAGAGTLVVTTGSYTGATVIDAGVLQIGSGAAAGSLSTSSAISGSAGATLVFNRTGIVTQGSQFSGAAITGGLGVTQLGSGTLVLNAANTYTGPTTIAAGAVEANNSQALGVGGNISFTGGRLRYTGSSAGVDFGSRIKNSTSGILLDLNGNNVTLSNIDASNTGGIPAWLGTTGTLTLAGVNSYSGNTTLTTSLNLNISSNQALGSGTLVVNGNGSLDNTSGSPVSIANNMNLSNGGPTFLGSSGPNAMLTIAGTTTLSVANRTITVSAGTLALGPLANADGSRNFTKGGNGTLILLNDANPSFTGQLVANGGNLILRTSNPLPNGTMTFSGGTVIGEAPANISFPRARFSGATIVSGTNSMTIADFVPTAAANLTNSLSGGATFTVTGTTTIGAGVEFGVAGTGDTYLLGPVTEAGAGGGLVKVNTGTLFLLGTNTYSGRTRVTGGTIVLGNNSALGSGTLTVSTGVVQAGADVVVTNTLNLENTGLTVSGSSSITFRDLTTTTLGRNFTNSLDPGKTLTFSGTTYLAETGTNVGRVLTLNGSGATVFNGPIVNGNATGVSGLSINAPGGSVTLNGTNTYSGTTSLTAGTVVLGSNPSAFGTSALNFLGGTISSSGSTTLTNRLLFGSVATPITYAGPGELYFTTTGTFQQSATIVPVLSGSLSLASMGGSGSVTKTGSGTLLLSGSLSTTTFAIEGGVARLVGSGIFNSGSTAPIVRAGTLDYNGSSSRVNNLTLGSATLSGTAAVLTGSGTLTTRAVANDTELTQLAGNVPGLVSGNLILSQNSSNDGSFVTVHEVTNASPDLVVAANMTSSTGSGILATLAKRGNGTLALSGSNSYSRLTIQSGVVRIDADQALVATGSLQLTSGTYPAASILGLNTSTAFTRSLGPGAGQVELAFGPLGNALGFAAYGSGSTRLVNLGGSGAAVTWGVNSFITAGSGVSASVTGTFALGAADADGTLDFLNPIALGGSGTNRSIQVARGSAAVDAILSGTLSGAAGILKTGSGILAVAAANTYTGTTSVAAGTLRVSDSGRIASSARIDVAAGAVLAFARTDGYGGAYDGKLTGSGLLSVQSGSLTITGLNTFAGNSQVLSGAILHLDGQINNTTLDIAAGATLMGSGTSLGLTTIAGIHNPGNSPGIQTFDDLIYTSSASVFWELWGNTDTTGNAGVRYDQIRLTGDLTFDSLTEFNLVFTGTPSNVSDVAWGNSFWDSPREWLVYDGLPTTTVTNLPALVQTNWQDSNGLSFFSLRPDASFRLERRNIGSGDDVYLVYSAIPEPGSLALAGIGLAAAAAIRRRRRGRRVA